MTENMQNPPANSAERALTYVLPGDLLPPQEDLGSPSKEAVVETLTAEEAAGRGSVFDSAFLTALKDLEKSDLTIAEIWQEVEDGFAAQNNAKARPNPYSK